MSFVWRGRASGGEREQHSEQTGRGGRWWARGRHECRHHCCQRRGERQSVALEAAHGGEVVAWRSEVERQELRRRWCWGGRRQRSQRVLWDRE